tara:strand:+ start:2155 stop:3186 length:1032 start_codon:yes stop_codon:yes gene_type:complete
MKKNKILVTGGLGYIGSHTTVELINQGFQVTIVDNLSNSEIFILDRIEKITGTRPKFYEFDLTERKKTENCFNENNFDGVIHFAALKSVSESIKKPLEYYNNNIKSLENILESMKIHSVRNIVFSSSCTVYGQPEELPVDERAPFKKAESPYTETKQISEKIIEKVTNSNNNISAISLRYFNPVGAHSSALLGELPKGIPNNLVPFITQTAAGIRDRLVVFGDNYDTHDGTAVRDYIHIEDLSEAHIAALERILYFKNENPYEYYNVGTGKGYSVMDVIGSFEKVNNIKLNYVFSERREGDIEKIFSDNKLSKKKLNWSSKKSLDDMMRSAWNWETAINKKIK